jgi:hypothetical protein
VTIETRFMQTEERKRPTCRCGHDRNHPLVIGERTYGFWAWVTLFAGASATPKKVTFRCQRCNQVVEVSRDPKVLQQHRS